jgi:hypothetical protein
MGNPETWEQAGKQKLYAVWRDYHYGGWQLIDVFLTKGEANGEATRQRRDRYTRRALVVPYVKAKGR